MGVSNEVDRATWARLTSAKEGCGVTGCTRAPVVSLSLTAREVTGGRGGGNLASEVARFYADHGEQRMVAALKGLRG